MNALELLLQRIRSPGSGSDPSWLSYLQELEASALPPRDPQVLAPGQLPGGPGNLLNQNALGIYAQPRPPPAGDEVIRSGQPAYTIPAMPMVPASDEQRWLSRQTTPSYLPGPGGSTRIAMHGPSGAVSRMGGGGSHGSGPALDEMMRASPAPQMPQWWLDMPEAVRRSILEEPVTIEGMPAAQNPTDRYQTLGLPLFQEEMAVRAGPQRESALAQGLNDVRNMNRTTQAIPETYGLTSRPQGQSPFASPLNQMMQWGQRAPFALY